MEFLKLIARGTRFIVTLPYQVASTIARYRGVTRRSVDYISGEVTELSTARRFFRALGLFLLTLILIAFVVAIFVGLWYLNYRLDLERQLAGPVPILRKVWLPLLLALFVGVCGVAYWLWKLLGPEREPDDFPDIRTAWQEACTALEAEGIRVTDLPLFLVLGRPATGIDSLFSASRLTFTVRQVPKRGDAPIQIYANVNALYIVCPGASLLARLAALFAGEGTGLDELKTVPSGTVFEQDAPPASDATGSTVLGEPEAPAEPLLLGETSAVATALAEEPEPEVQPRRRIRLLKKTEEVERLQARLHYLGRLLTFHRRPYCGVNGILLLLPFASARDDEDASQTATLAQMDLAVARDSLRTDCPVFTIICDLEFAPGAVDFLRHFPEERRQRLLGQAFPLVPDLPRTEAPDMVASGVRWIGEATTRLALRFLRSEASLRENAAICLFLGSVRSRLDGWGHILARTALLGDGQRPLLGGCYLAATGPDPARDQAFVAGVFRLLAEHQNFVAWTPDARAEEADYQRWAFYGYLGIALFTVASLVVGYFQLRG